MAAPALLLPGTRLGRYELIRALAVGGMAEIHLARVAGLEGFSKLVVLKRILPQLATDEELVRLFLAEARLAARLHHPNIVEVFDVGVEDGSHFMAMEYVRGENLAQVIAAAIQRRRGLSLAAALTIVAGVAEGLHHAHEQRDADGTPLGIVHRDVSPTNVLLSYDGRVKVCDFGIARIAAHHAHITAAPRGKLSYMSPEQVRGEPVDRRSDVFALGILLYELTTGRRLFRGASDREVSTRICDEDAPPPSSTRAGYPPALERIVLRALRRDAAERHAAAQDLQVEIEELARAEQLVLSSVALSRYLRELFGDPPAEVDSAAGPVTAPTPRRARWPIAGALAAATVAAAAGLFAVSASGRREAAVPDAAVPPSPPVSVQLVVDAGAPPPEPITTSTKPPRRPRRPAVAAPATPTPVAPEAVAPAAPVDPVDRAGRPPLQ